MVGCAEAMLKRLELPFRTMLLCTGDMGFSRPQDLRPGGLAAVAGPLPRDQLLLELRRLPGPAHGRALPSKAGEKGTRFVHTLNGSGLAVGRTLVAVMENYQDEGGRIAIPQALQPYMARPDPHRRARPLADPAHQRRRDPCRGPGGAGADRRASLSDDVWVVRAGVRAVGRQPGADPCRPDARAPLDERRFAVTGTPDRLRHAGDPAT